MQMELKVLSCGGDHSPGVGLRGVAFELGYIKKSRFTRGCVKWMWGNAEGHDSLSWTRHWPKHYNRQFIRRASKPANASKHKFACQFSEVFRKAFMFPAILKSLLGCIWKVIVKVSSPVFTSGAGRNPPIHKRRAGLASAAYRWWTQIRCILSCWWWTVPCVIIYL